MDGSLASVLASGSVGLLLLYSIHFQPCFLIMISSYTLSSNFSQSIDGSHPRTRQPKPNLNHSHASYSLYHQVLKPMIVFYTPVESFNPTNLLLFILSSSLPHHLHPSSIFHHPSNYLLTFLILHSSNRAFRLYTLSSSTSTDPLLLPALL